MTISTLDHIDGFGRAVKWAMELDLDASTKLLRHNKMLSINSCIDIPLSELERMPVIGLLEPRKSNA